MPDFDNIKADLDIEYGLTASVFVNKRMQGRLHTSKYSFAVGSCLYVSLKNQSSPTDDTLITKDSVRNGIKQFNNITKSTVPFTF